MDGKLVIVASDCTGHGVPGALLTMLGVSALEKIVGQEKETNPEEILKKLDVDISEKLSDGSKYQLNGMDIAVVVIDEKLNQAIYSGAMREITIVDKEGNVNNLKPNFVSIASGRLKGKVKSELINLNKGDCLFLYSDGYQDQFKGNIEKVETYNFKRFQDLLLKLSNQEFKLADIYLEKDLKAWKGDKEQIDDIMIIGLKF